MLQLVVSCIVGVASSVLPLRVDLGMDTGRSDTANPRWQEWQVEDGPQATRQFGAVDVVLSAVGDDQVLRGEWFKPGLATGAKMATDGVAAVCQNGAATLQLEIHGLNPGRHSLVTHHNELTRGAASPLLLSSGTSDSHEITPSTFVTTNEAAESGYLEFDVIAGNPVVVQMQATNQASTSRVILNGFEIDGSDPQHRAALPSPVDGNWHADGDTGTITLRWESAASAIQHDVFLAADSDPQQAVRACAEATKDSPAYLGNVDGAGEIKAEVAANRSHLHYCWRVDSVSEDGTVTRGDLWQFRVRQLAFPGAEGYGRFAIGGRGGHIIKVTNLEDSGPGSLRAAVEAEGPRTVIFDISGRIILQNRLVIRNPYLTIAGQTAPSKGICISNYNLGMLGAHDCIVRFMRVRPGNTAGKTLDGMGMASTDHSIVDHCSISWTQDEAFSSRGARNITLQRTLISEALNVAGHKKYKEGTQHGYAASIGGDVGSFHHNLLAHCAGRNWSLAGGIDQAHVHAGRLDIRNNLVYNWSYRTTDGGARQVNFVNNYYKPGPATKLKTYLNPQFENPAFGPQQYYVAGNVMENVVGAEGPTGEFAGMRVRGRQEAPVTVATPFFAHHVKTHTAEEAMNEVLADVGCNRPVLDEHDRRIIEETRTGTHRYQGSVTGLPGLPDSQEDVGGWEDYPTMRRAEDWDADDDGLPTWWEERQGLDPNSPPGDLADAHADPDGNGYSHLEEYLHWMATPGKEPPK
ncbi:hypothetical protein OAS39_05950 [Pirellulales bacterium]|nr:hypothetical protein [Pirellulales bacterium]